VLGASLACPVCDSGVAAAAAAAAVTCCLRNQNRQNFDMSGL
jgi:hypothetical protein